MKLIAYSIYDEKAECFGTPLFYSATGLVARLFKEWCNDPTIPPGKNPEDFKLYEIGTWDNHAAKFDTLDVPKFIGNGLDYVENTRERQVDGQAYVLKKETP